MNFTICEIGDNGIHQYVRTDNDRDEHIIFNCVYCSHIFKLLKTEFYPDWPVTVKEDHFEHFKPLNKKHRCST